MALKFMCHKFSKMNIQYIPDNTFSVRTSIYFIQHFLSLHTSKSSILLLHNPSCGSSHFKIQASPSSRVNSQMSPQHFHRSAMLYSLFSFYFVLKSFNKTYDLTAWFHSPTSLNAFKKEPCFFIQSPGKTVFFTDRRNFLPEETDVLVLDHEAVTTTVSLLCYHSVWCCDDFSFNPYCYLLKFIFILYTFPKLKEG